MRLVLDCSVAISWCLPDETNAYADAVLILLWADTEAVVPIIWWLEIVNVLLVAERRRRTTEVQTAEALAVLRALPIIVDANTAERSTSETLALAREYNLAAYDAAITWSISSGKKVRSAGSRQYSQRRFARSSTSRRSANGI